jgi:hypothetical protein
MEYAECVLFAHYQISIKQSAFVQMGQYSIWFGLNAWDAASIRFLQQSSQDAFAKRGSPFSIIIVCHN